MKIRGRIIIEYVVYLDGCAEASFKTSTKAVEYCEAEMCDTVYREESILIHNRAQRLKITGEVKCMRQGDDKS